jgi:hypothetical protein
LRTADGVLDLLEEVTRVAEEAGARRCKSRKTMSFSREQADAHLLLESGDRFGERGLRDLQPMRGAMKI